MLVFADCESHQAAAACQEVLELPPVLPLVPVRHLTGARWSRSGQASACGYGATVSIRSDVFIHSFIKSTSSWARPGSQSEQRCERMSGGVST